MALITCKDCEKQFSTDAKRCPHCGARKPGIGNIEIGCLPLLMIIILMVILVGMCTSGTDNTKSTSTSAPAQTESNNDVSNAYSIGNQLKASGAITGFEVSGWHQRLDLNISSLLPGDARTLADYICPVARKNFTWPEPWTIRVFIVSGERPAAECEMP